MSSQVSDSCLKLAIDFETRPIPQQGFDERQDLKKNGIARWMGGQAPLIMGVAATTVPYPEQDDRCRFFPRATHGWELIDEDEIEVFSEVFMEPEDIPGTMKKSRLNDLMNRHKHCFVVSHNALFDRALFINWIRDHLKWEFNMFNWTCSMRMAAALNLPEGLDKLSKTLLQEGKMDSGKNLIAEIQKKQNYSVVPEMCQYAEHDALLSMRCMRKMVKLEKLFEKDRESDPTPSPRLTQDLLDDITVDIKVSTTGVPVDPLLIKQACKRRNELISHANMTVAKATGNEIVECTNTEKLLNWTVSMLPASSGLTNEKFGKSQEDVKKVAEAVKAFKPNLAPMLDAVMTGTMTQTNKWVVASRKIYHGRIHDLFHFCGTHTGRSSSSGLQFQNFPRSGEPFEDITTATMRELSNNLRTMVAAPEGKVLIKADFSQIQFRIYMMLLGRLDLLQRNIEGHDLYKELASMIYNSDPDQVTKEQRYLGKQTVLSFQFGQRAKSAMNIIDIGGLSLAQKAYKAFHDMIPEAMVLWKDLEKALLSKKSKIFVGFKDCICVKHSHNTGIMRVKLPTGREMVSWNFKTSGDNASFRDYSKNGRETSLWGAKLANYVCQGTERDMMMDVIKSMHYLCHMQDTPFKNKARVIGQVHDEIIVEANEDVADLVELALRKSMEKTATKSPHPNIQMTADISQGRSWA